MNIRLSLLPCLLRFEETRLRKRNFRDATVFPQRTTSVALGVLGPIRRWHTDFLFDYRVFPPSIIQAEGEWRHGDRRMAVGDIIHQHALLPPIGFGLCLDFAVRICALIDEPKRLGFAYETLTGHAESGIAEFYFEEKNAELFFTIRTFSRPGHWISRLGNRLATLPYQAWCTQQSLEYVKLRFLGEH